MKAEVDTKQFKKLITALKPFTRNDEARLMQYIYFEVSAGEVRFEAIDGYRIAVEYIACNADSEFKGYIKPISFAFMKEDKIYLERINDVLEISDGIFSVKIKQPEGEWFNTKEMIKNVEDKEKKLDVGVNAKYLIDAVKNVQDTYGRDLVIIECRESKAPIIIRDAGDKRNIRLVLPVNHII